MLVAFFLFFYLHSCPCFPSVSCYVVLCLFIYFRSSNRIFLAILLTRFSFFLLLFNNAFLMIVASIPFIYFKFSSFFFLSPFLTCFIQMIRFFSFLSFFTKFSSWLRVIFSSIVSSLYTHTHIYSTATIFFSFSTMLS